MSIADIVNAVTAFATIAAVIVALYISNKQIEENRAQIQEQIEENRLQATEERQHQSRPIVVPTGDITGPPDFYLPNGYIKWEEVEAKVQLRNMGDGAALNVHGMLYGPQPALHYHFVSWDNGPIEGKSSETIICTHLPQHLALFPGDSIDGIHKLYEIATQGSSPSNSQGYQIARLTITYHDLFGNKLESIFDYTLEHQWVCKTISKIPSLNGKSPLDLKELNDQKRLQAMSTTGQKTP